jgi:low affinity Fe/Cu permease
MLNFRTALMTRPDVDRLQPRLDALVDAFTKYRIPVVTLKDLSIEEVCPIFERINSSGTKLSIYDLMVAATWSERVDRSRPGNYLLSGYAAG